MKKIWLFLRLQLKENFHTGWYSTVLIFLAICIVLNYQFDFQDRILESADGILKLACYFLFYTFAFSIAIGSLVAFKKRSDVLRNKAFWTICIFGLCVLTLDSGFPYMGHITETFVQPKVQFWAYKVGKNVMSFFTVMLPLIVFHRYFPQPNSRNYGLGNFRFDWSPYVTMLAVMLPIIVLASFNGSFLRQYPMYKTSQAHVALDVTEFVTALIYELAYGADFITVEMLFRGFFVIGMIHVLGRDAILPMAVIYCFLHFAKPAGEAVSSIFGGYLLGTIAYETRSIWGGIIVHIGIAWMMETTAYMQKLFN